MGLNREQERAKAVWKWLNIKEPDIKEISKICKSLPAMLQMNGLLQMLVYLLQKESRKKLGIQDFLLGMITGKDVNSSNFNNFFEEKLLNANFSQMRGYEADARAYLNELKKLAVAKEVMLAKTPAKEAELNKSETVNEQH